MHERALEDFSAALRLDPKNLQAAEQRGLALVVLDRHGEAVADHLEAIRLSPRAARAYDNFARFWLDCPDPVLRDTHVALELAQRACELSRFGDWQYVATLARACAAEGHESRAREHAAQALELAPPGERQQCRVLLRNYLSQ